MVDSIISDAREGKFLPAFQIQWDIAEQGAL